MSRESTSSFLRLAAALLLSGLAMGAAPEAAKKPKSPTTPESAPSAPTAPDPYAGLQYRFIGPPGNRVAAVVGVPGDPNVAYAGASSGGVWKTTDGGIHWKAVFDDQPAQSIGSIAIAPSDPNVVWVGTGETFIRSNVSLGDGIYKSTDAGKTWKNMGLAKTGRIGRIAIDPHNTNIVFAAALGTCYGPQPERGVYRTTDGGKNWDRVLFVDENTGASDLSMDPSNPRILFAGMWQIDIKTWGRKSGGPGSGVFVSKDGGSTWKRITGHGLPETPLGKIAVAVAPSSSDRVYALIETGDRGSLWRSDDGGQHWKKASDSRLLNERPHYYTRMLVTPDNANEVYFPSNQMGVTYDGGETSEQIRWGGDNHDMWADARQPSRMMIGNDGGVMLTTTRGREWSSVRLPIGQMYHVTTDNRIPYFVYGQMQDDGSMRGPSHLPGAFGIPAAAWTSTAGCETGWATPDPVDSNIVWGGCYAGVVERFDAKTGQTRTVSVWPERTMGANAGQIKLRMNWTFPIAISPHDHNTVYVGSQYVHATSDGGQTWKTISPDLTTNDKSMMGDSGGLTVDNLSVEYAGVVYSIAESPREKGVIWAGTNDGQVQVTRDGGAHWSNVTPGIPGLPRKGTVGSVDPSPFEGGACYVAFDRHQVNGFDPLLYKTADYGKTWKSISGNIPKGPLSYTHVVREDPFRKGLLYAGTENALYVSFDDGGHWEPLQGKLPHAPVYWLTVQPHFHDLVVGTYGRGFFILDDMTPLEQVTDSIRASAFHLFEPRPAYRFRSVSRPNLAPAGVAGGRNPAYGATINYWLKEAPKSREEEKESVPPPPGKTLEGVSERPPAEAAAEDSSVEPAKKKSPVELTIWNEAGEKIRTIPGAAKVGFNRVAWDLRYEPTEEVRIRTTPTGNPHIWEEKRFRGKDRRGVYYYGIDAPKRGPLVPPGTYTVKMAYAGKEETQKLVVRKDPSSAGTDADVEVSAKFARALARDVDAAAGMINQLEWTRLQLEGYRKMLGAANAPRPEITGAEELEKKIRSVEDRLLQPTLAEADLKSFRGPLELYLKLVWLLAESETGGGDVSGNADFPPTAAEREVNGMLGKQLAEVLRDFDELYGKTIPAFNETAKVKGFALMTVKEPPAPRTEKPEEPDEDR
jgi:photosystem II stability/assembly factor-like uncharacterized protein